MSAAEKSAQRLVVGDTLLLPMGRTARVTAVTVGRVFTTYTTAEYGKSRVENTYPMLVEQPHKLLDIGPSVGQWNCSCGQFGYAPFKGAIAAHEDHAALAQ